MMTLHESISLGAAILKAESKGFSDSWMWFMNMKNQQGSPNFVDMFQELEGWHCRKGEWGTPQKRHWDGEFSTLV